MVTAIGIMPSTVDTAVSMIGRKRDTAASITASQGGMPWRRSVSTWSIRITALRAIMPINARIPRIATNPSDWRNSSSAPTTPISPIGTTLSTRNSRLKLCSWIIRNVSIRNSIAGTTATTEACEFWLSSTVPPTSIR